MPDDDSQETDTERGAGVLTRSQRKYLLGEKEFENSQSERDMRYKIRERVKNGLLDFKILAQELEPRDREQIFKDVRPAALRGDKHVDIDEMPEIDTLEGLVHTLSFLYLAANDADVPFEKAIELGVSEAVLKGPFMSRSLDVTIDESVEFDYEEIFEKIGQGEGLNDVEYTAVKSLFLQDMDRYLEMCREADADVRDKLAADEKLSRGESLVVVGLVTDGERKLMEYSLDELMHDDVQRELGLDQFLRGS